MYTLGPFNLLEIGSPPTQITVNVGKNGFVEILNYTGFLFQVGIGTFGTCWHDAYGRAIYPIQNAMGPQTISIGIAVSPDIDSCFGQPNLLFQEASGFGDIIGRYYINVYQEGEAQWYPPYSMTNPVPQMLSGYATKTAVGASLSLSLPIQAPVGGLGRCYLTGFDFTCGINTTPTSATLTLTNVIAQESGSSSLAWRFTTGANGLPLQQVRFPAPIPNDPGNQPTYSIGSLGATAILNAYYYLQ